MNTKLNDLLKCLILTPLLCRLRAQCVFLNPSMILPAGLETSPDSPNSIAVAWTESTNICHYNLVRQVKGKLQCLFLIFAPGLEIKTCLFGSAVGNAAL